MGKVVLPEMPFRKGLEGSAEELSKGEDGLLLVL